MSTWHHFSYRDSYPTEAEALTRLEEFRLYKGEKVDVYPPEVQCTGGRWVVLWMFKIEVPK